MSETAKPSPAPAKLALITGLSGSGKSTVAKCFEDLNYYTVDNLPLPLLRQFLDHPLELVRGYDRIAVVTDVRAPGFAEEFPRLIAEIDRQGIDVTLLFLEASDEVIVRRFSETRRPHPLIPDRPVIEGIRREREVLAELRTRADMVFDTSEWSIHEIRTQVYREFASHPGGMSADAKPAIRYPTISSVRSILTSASAVLAMPGQVPARANALQPRAAGADSW